MTVNLDAARKLLIIEDDPAQRSILSSAAREAGCRVLAAETLSSAVEKLTAETFDCVSVDLSLGDRDGIELLRLVGNLNPVPRVLIVSGCDQRILDATVRMARASGLVDATSITKPINLIAFRDWLTHSSLAEKSPKSGPALRPIEADEISGALARSEFYPVFQPKVDMVSGRVVGCETLARWNRQDQSFIPPSEFIPAVKTAGRLQEFTMSLLQRSLVEMATLLRSRSEFHMAVNIAPSLLTAIDLPERIESLLGAEGVAPSRLIVEITEDAMVANEVIAADILLRLRIKGVGLAIDDFGTGYSSLASLARMPFNELKIDRSFVHNCRADNDFMKIVKASIGIAHDLNMKAVAEGIEDEATKDILANLKCDIGQGYLFSKPLPAADFIDWVFDWSRYSGSRQKIKA